MLKLTTLATTFLIVLAMTDPGSWIPQQSGTEARFRGLSVVSDQFVWASGSQGTIVRTIDGGKTWKPCPIPNESQLDFRDIEAFDGENAFVLSIGPGELSRIYKTSNGGRTWTLQYKNVDPRGFLDAIAFWNPREGLALGDPIDGRFTLLRTLDGGTTWTRLEPASLPPALANEGAFAASGTCLVTWGASHAWFGTGGASKARVFATTDKGQTWSVATAPIQAGEASKGIFSVAFRDEKNGLVVGGDYKQVDDPALNLATTSDGGRTWTLAETSKPSGFRSAVAFSPTQPGLVVAAGPSGCDVSLDLGRTWSLSNKDGFHAFQFSKTGNPGWGVGEKGRVGKFEPAR